MNAVASYADFSGLANLRSQAQKDAGAAIDEVGQQFESYFMQMMLKSMREANEVLKSDLLSSDSIDAYEEMYHQELSVEMAKNGSLGVSAWMKHAMEKNMGMHNETHKSIEAYRALNGARAMKSYNVVMKWVTFSQLVPVRLMFIVKR